MLSGAVTFCALKSGTDDSWEEVMGTTISLRDVAACISQNRLAIWKQCTNVCVSYTQKPPKHFLCIEVLLCKQHKLHIRLFPCQCSNWASHYVVWSNSFQTDWLTDHTTAACINLYSTCWQSGVCPCAATSCLE